MNGLQSSHNNNWWILPILDSYSHKHVPMINHYIPIDSTMIFQFYGKFPIFSYDFPHGGFPKRGYPQNHPWDFPLETTIFPGFPIKLWVSAPRGLSSSVGCSPPPCRRRWFVARRSWRPPGATWGDTVHAKEKVHNGNYHEWLVEASKILWPMTTSKHHPSTVMAKITWNPLKFHVILEASRFWQKSSPGPRHLAVTCSRRFSRAWRSLRCTSAQASSRSGSCWASGASSRALHLRPMEREVWNGWRLRLWFWLLFLIHFFVFFFFFFFLLLLLLLLSLSSLLSLLLLLLLFLRGGGK